MAETRNPMQVSQDTIIKGCFTERQKAGLRKLTRGTEIHRDSNSRKGKTLVPLGLKKQGKN